MESTYYTVKLCFFFCHCRLPISTSTLALKQNIKNKEYIVDITTTTSNIIIIITTIIIIIIIINDNNSVSDNHKSSCRFCKVSGVG